jgi:IS5 family transposase
METSHCLRQMRWWGLAKAGVQIRLTAIAYDFRRTPTIMVMA